MPQSRAQIRTLGNAPHDARAGRGVEMPQHEAGAQCWPQTGSAGRLWPRRRGGHRATAAHGRAADRCELCRPLPAQCWRSRMARKAQARSARRPAFYPVKRSARMRSRRRSMASPSRGAHTRSPCAMRCSAWASGRGLRKGSRFQPVDRQAKKARCVGVSAARLARARRTDPQRRGCTAGDEGCTPALCECTVAASGREWGLCSGGAARAQRPSVLAQPDGRILCGDCLG